MIYILNFILGASWAIALVGALIFIYYFHFFGFFISGFVGASFGLILAFITHLLIKILSYDKICDKRS